MYKYNEEYNKKIANDLTDVWRYFDNEYKIHPENKKLKFYRDITGRASLLIEETLFNPLATYLTNYEKLARVVSPQEISRNNFEILYIEIKGDDKLLQITKKNDEILGLILNESINFWPDYNKKYRCWNKEPTVEQMKDVLWDGD